MLVSQGLRVTKGTRTCTPMCSHLTHARSGVTALFKRQLIFCVTARHARQYAKYMAFLPQPAPGAYYKLSTQGATHGQFSSRLSLQITNILDSLPPAANSGGFSIPYYKRNAKGATRDQLSGTFAPCCKRNTKVASRDQRPRTLAPQRKRGAQLSSRSQLPGRFAPYEKRSEQGISRGQLPVLYTGQSQTQSQTNRKPVANPVTNPVTNHP